MLIDLSFYTLSGGSPDFDLLVVGAGPAGISLAREFLGTRWRVCLIDSGSLEFSETAQSLNEGDNIGLRYYRLDECRYRRFGGSMCGWPDTVKHAPTSITPMDPLDFEPREWVPYSGWPFRRSEIEPHFARAQALFTTGPWDYDPASWETPNSPFQPFDPSRLTTRIWQYSPGMNFGRKFRAELAAAPNIQVITNATACEVVTDTFGQRVTGVRAASLDGVRTELRARIVVLACGAIETARLLLLSTAANSNGLGNGGDLVGRYFMEHPHLPSAQVKLSRAKDWIGAYKNRTVQGVKVRAGICLSEEAQRRRQVLNHSAIVVDEFLLDADTRQKSEGYVALKHLVAGVRDRRGLLGDLHRPIASIGADLPNVLRGIFNHARGLNGAIYTRSEQAPNPDSRVMLSAERDRLGLQKVSLNWRLTPLDKLTIRVAVEEIQHEFARLGLGTVKPMTWLVADDHSWPSWTKGGYHHMGTTRMATTPRAGVVDPHCRIWDVHNLYVAGAGVFPVGGYANPTLTLVAMSLRLADRLKVILGRPDAVARTKSQEIILESS